MKKLSHWLLEDKAIASVYTRGKSFFVDRAEDLSQHRSQVKARLELALREFGLSMKSPDLPTEHLESLLADTQSYVQWLRWSLDDVGYYSLGLGLDSGLMARRIAACHFVYQSGRLLDDLIDGHQDYKGLKETSFGARRNYWREKGIQDRAEKECLLIAISLLLRGVRDYATCFGEFTPVAAIRNLLHTVTNACLGAIIELNEQIPHNPESYQQIVKLKTSAHNAILLQPFFGMVPMETFHELEGFYKQSSLAGQILNDAHDIEEDLQIGQINYFNVGGKSREGTALTESEVDKLGNILRELAGTIEAKSGGLREACAAKFSTIVDNAEQIELK